jgi:hypothetical protein
MPLTALAADEMIALGIFCLIYLFIVWNLLADNF